MNMGRLRLILGILVLCAGCGPLGERGPEEAVAYRIQVGTSNPFRQEQSRLLGNEALEINTLSDPNSSCYKCGVHWRFSYTGAIKWRSPLSRLEIGSGGRLLSRSLLTAEAVQGVQLSGRRVGTCRTAPAGSSCGTWAPQSFQITEVIQANGQYEYTVMNESTNTDLCGDGGRATPVAALWNTHGDRVNSPDEFTFACSWGAIAKCVKNHGNDGFDYDPAKVSTNANLTQSMHQACVRAARADYGGDGISYTCPSTKIILKDDVGINDPTATDLSGRLLESYWSTDGARCLTQPRHLAVDPAAIGKNTCGSFAFKVSSVNLPFKFISYATPVNALDACDELK